MRIIAGYVREDPLRDREKSQGVGKKKKRGQISIKHRSICIDKSVQSPN